MLLLQSWCLKSKPLKTCQAAKNPTPLPRVRSMRLKVGLIEIGQNCRGASIFWQLLTSLCHASAQKKGAAVAACITPRIL